MHKIFLYSLFFIFALTVPFFVTAQESDSSLVTCSGANCQPCHLVQMANNIIEFLVIVLTAVAALIFAYAGFILTTSGGDVTAKEKAKTIFTNVLIGYLIVLAAWLLIDTGMKALLDEENEKLGPWNEIKCETQPKLETSDISWDDSDWLETGPDEVGHVLTTGAEQDTLPAGIVGDRLSHEEARARLEAAGIITKNGVSYEGLQPHVVDRAIALKEQCGCNITVTSATDGNHASGAYSHENGFKLDFRSLREGSDFKLYIEEDFGKLDHYWSDGTPVYRNGNTLCAVESDHVDCAFHP